jgi:hypothetical protein
VYNAFTYSLVRTKEEEEEEASLRDYFFFWFFPRALFIYLFFSSGLGCGSVDRKFHWESFFPLFVLFAHSFSQV